MSSFSLKNNLTIDNNRYFNWLNYAGNTRHNVIGLNTSDNLIITPPHDMHVNNNTSSNVYINNLSIQHALHSNSAITLSKNSYLSVNDSADGFIGFSSSLITTGSSRILLYGSAHSSSAGTIDIYSGTNTSSSLNFYNGTSNSLVISNNVINLNNSIQVSDVSSTVGNVMLFSNTTQSISSSTGSIIIKGGVGLEGNLSLNGQIFYNNTSASTSASVGSLVLSGGLSISNSTSATDTNNGGALTIAGGVSIGKNTLIGGNVTLYNNTSTTSTSSFDANLVVYGGLGINDAIYLRSNNSQINIAPVNNGNPTTINFYDSNNYTGNRWLIGQSNSNFVISSNATGASIVSLPNSILSNITVGNIYFTGLLYQNGSLYAGPGSADSGGNLTISNLVVDHINIGTSDFFSGSFNAANNVVTPTAITNLIFSDATVTSFIANVSVVIYINAVASLYETFTLSGSYMSSGWILTNYSVGDISGINFSIDSSSGQILYTSTNITNWTSGIIRYNVSTNNVSGSYYNLSSSMGNAVTSTIVLTNTTDAVYGSSIGSLYSFGGATFNKKVLISGDLISNNINFGVSSYFGGSFNAANNVAVASNVTGFVFDSSNVVSFNANVSVVIIATTNLYENFTINGSYSNSGWILTSTSRGDISGITFSIDSSSGQVQYTSTNASGWSSGTIRFTINQHSRSGNYSSLSVPTTGNSYIFDSISLTNTSDAVLYSNTGSLNVVGGATINKTVLAGGLTVTGATVLSGGVTTGCLNVTGASVLSGGVSASTISANVVSSGSIATPGATVGTLSATSITTANAQLTGTLNVTGASILSGGITTGNINFTGSLYQNNSLYTVTLPPGFIIQYASSSAPSGWLLCDGSAVSRTTYSALFAIISTTYGSGDGSTTFNLPDLRGRVPIGFGQGSGLTNRNMANTGGAETHTLTTSEMPSHTHNDSGHTHAIPGGTFGGSGGYTANDTATSGRSTYTGYANIQAAGGGGAHNNMQPFVVVNFVIKT
jgi:microcystin-dependent protein